MLFYIYIYNRICDVNFRKIGNCNDEKQEMLRICEKRVSLLNTRNAYQFERVRSLRLESHFEINFKDRGVESRKKLKICGEDFRF